jgi:HK97 family phage major capsid protein
LDPVARRAALKALRKAILDDFERVMLKAVAEDRDIEDGEQERMDDLKAEVRVVDREIEQLDAQMRLDDPLARLSPQEEQPPMIRTSEPVVTPITRAVAAPAVHGTATQERQHYSFGRALCASAGDDRQFGIDVGLEMEVHAEIIRRGWGPKHGGFMISFPGLLGEIARYEKRDFGTLPGSPGAPLTSVSFRPDLFAYDVASLRAALPTARLGIQTITSDEPLVRIPRMTTNIPEAEWIPRDSAGTMQGDIATRTIELTPKTAHSQHQIMRSARHYSRPDAYAIYAREVASKMVRAIARATLYGSRANEPAGIMTYPIRSYNFGTGGAPGDVDWMGLMEMASIIEGLPIEDLGTQAKRSWFFNRLMEISLGSTWKALHDPTAAGGAVLTSAIIPDGFATGGGGGVMMNRPFVSSPVVPTRPDRSSDIWYADWDAAVTCLFGPGLESLSEVVTSPGNVKLHAWLDMDTACLDPDRFVLAVDGLLVQAAPPTITP